MAEAQVRRRVCKHGWLSFLAEDEFVGKSLALYGEYSEEEVLAMSKIIRPGDVVVEVGANIGSLTVPMARMLEPDGTLIAFEPQPANFELLRRNVRANDLTLIVDTIDSIVTDHNGYASLPTLEELGHHNFGRVEVGKGSLQVSCKRIDDLQLDKLRLLKIDAEGHELEVINGAEETIKRLRPHLYVENDRPEKCSELIAKIVDLGYRAWWHRPPLWNKDNFDKNAENVFGEIVSLNMYCTPEEAGTETEGLDEVGDIRVDDEIYTREIKRYTRIVERDPKDLTARLMLAHYHNLMQHLDISEALIEENLRRDPEHYATRAIKGMHQLQAGDYVNGWKGYELRYSQKTTQPFGARKFDFPQWDGKPTSDMVLIWGEQGFGDHVMFARFLTEAYRRAPNAVVDVPAQLYELFETSGLVPMGRLFRRGRKLPKCTQHCSIPSLPYVLDIGNDISYAPYMKADEAMVERWHDRNVYQAGRHRIGVCPFGSPISERPFTRDIDPKFLGQINRFGPFMSLHQQGQFESFADTAAAIKSLDLVITVDTAVAHLAGALGVPTWLLLSHDPDWRWGLRGSTTDWYDSIRIFRQPKLFDWKSVLDEVEEALEDNWPMEARDGHRRSVGSGQA